MQPPGIEPGSVLHRRLRQYDIPRASLWAPRTERRVATLDIEGLVTYLLRTARVDDIRRQEFHILDTLRVTVVLVQFFCFMCRVGRQVFYH